MCRPGKIFDDNDTTFNPQHAVRQALDSSNVHPVCQNPLRGSLFGAPLYGIPEIKEVLPALPVHRKLNLRGPVPYHA